MYETIQKVRKGKGNLSILVILVIIVFSIVAILPMLPHDAKQKVDSKIDNKVDSKTSSIDNNYGPKDGIVNGIITMKMMENSNGANLETTGTIINSTELRFITIGDPQGKADKTKNVADFINSIPNDKINFTVFLGDYIDKDTVDAIKNNMQKPYYVVEGNHDVGHFNNYWNISPEQYYQNVSGYQIVIPAFNWESYNWSQISKTVPTLVFNHGPVLPNCGSEDKLHRYAFDMKSELDKLNVLAFYNGHTHTWQKDIVNGTLYVAEDSLSSGDKGSCHDGASDYVGYTFIRTNGTLSYTRLNYNEPFVDPFY